MMEGKRIGVPDARPKNKLPGEYHELAGIKIKLNKPGAGGRCLHWNSTGLAVKVGHPRTVGVQRGVSSAAFITNTPGWLNW
jgi:hypothetical protein